MKIGEFEINLVIFDMDGVLFDTERLGERFWQEAAEKFNYKISDEIFRKTIGLDGRKTKEIYRKYYGDEFPYMDMRSEKIKLEKKYILSEGVPVKEGLFELLEYLKEIKLKIALATSTVRERTELLLDSAGIKKYFEVITCGDEIENGKPDPDIFLKTSQKMGCRPENCIVLEDSKNGVRGASSAGMLPIMVPDITEPPEEIEALLFKKFNNLTEVKIFFKEFTP